MVQSVEIRCGVGTSAYVVVLTGDNIPQLNVNDLEVMLANARDELRNGGLGEMTVSALLMASRGGIRSVERLRDGVRNDGPNGEPAVQQLNGGGRPLRVEHYRNGRRHDGWGGKPAILEFDEHGRLIHAVRYRHGEPIGAQADISRWHTARETGIAPRGPKPL
jgi:hypothetical protein